MTVFKMPVRERTPVEIALLRASDKLARFRPAVPFGQLDGNDARRAAKDLHDLMLTIIKPMLEVFVTEDAIVENQPLLDAIERETLAACARLEQAGYEIDKQEQHNASRW